MRKPLALSPKISVYFSRYGLFSFGDWLSIFSGNKQNYLWRMKSNGEHFHWLFPLAGSPGWKLFQLIEQGQKSLWDLSSLMPVISVSGCCSSCVTCRDFSKIKLWGWMVRLPFASSAVSLSWYHLSYRNVLRKETGHQESIGASMERQTYLQTLLTLLHFRNMLWVTTREKGKKQ